MQVKFSIVFLFANFLVCTSFSQNSSVNLDYPFKKYSTSKEALRVVKVGELTFTGGTNQFKTRILKALKDKPTFAGHCIVVVWGCGASCQQSAIINLKTKKVLVGPNSATGFLYYLNSRLLVANPFYEDSPDYISKTTNLYLLQRERLNLIKTIINN